MDSFFGIGLPELILILLLAGLVMGPQRIRVVARQLGRITARLQGISRQFAHQLNMELDALEGDDVKGAWDEVRQLQKEVRALRDELGQAPRSIANEGKGAIEDAQNAYNLTPGKNNAEAGATEFDVPEIGAPQAEALEIEASEAEPLEIGVSETDAVEAEALEAEAPLSGEAELSKRKVTLPKALDIPDDPE